MNKIIFSILGIAVAIVFFFTLLGAMDETEKAECYKWAKWSKEYQNFYLAKWQSDQCKNQGIEVVAEVR